MGNDVTDYIRREAALKYIKSEQCKTCSDIGLCGNCAVLVAVKLLEKVPAADVAPVVHGRWIKDDFLSDDVNNAEKCSQCGELIGWFGNLPNYCPNCGAKMDRGEDRAVS